FIKMKKIIILSSLFLLIEGITALMLVYNHEEDIYIFANVDALASEESSEGGNKCYKNVTDDPADQVVYCGTCRSIPGRGSKKSVCYK
ncbi:MAG: hypothetical protein SOT20_02850, partial [Candidatus Cryptobacteroides sp.]|nr:hypothetical protein [Candidatus Cryptobacteroides sp.]